MGESSVILPGIRRHIPLTPILSADGLNAFRSFLQSEFSEENVEFWMSCEEFKKIKDPVKMAAKANKIYEDFIQAEGPREVIDFLLKFFLKKSVCCRTGFMFHFLSWLSDRFASHSLRLQVNIDHFTKGVTLRNLVKLSPATFDLAQKRIYALMEKDSFGRFIRSELYQDLLAN